MATADIQRKDKILKGLLVCAESAHPLAAHLYAGYGPHMAPQNIFRIVRVTALYLTATVLFPVNPALADVREIQAMTFGQWVVTDNTASHYVSVATDGSYNNSPELIMLEPPIQGIYEIDELPDGFVVNDVTVSIRDPLNYGSRGFLMDDFQVIYSPAVVDGVIGVTLGARARTTGDGYNYGDGVYRGVLTIEIHL